MVLNPCDGQFWGVSLQGDVMGDRIPRCPVCTGVVKPDIVFFGEQLPQRFLLHLADFPMADLLFVIGTSLEVWERGKPLGKRHAENRARRDSGGERGLRGEGEKMG